MMAYIILCVAFAVGMVIVAMSVATWDDEVKPHNSHKAYVQENENGSVYLSWRPDSKSEKSVLVYEEKE